MNNTPAAKKQKLNPAPRAPSLTPAANPAKVKGEPGIPKQAKVSHWAPEGYYYVKAVSFLSPYCFKGF
jgi:hypothetical protein